MPVLDIDHNGLAAVMGRLIALEVRQDYLADPRRFRHTEPEGRGELIRVVTDMRLWTPRLAVVDSVGEMVPMFGSSNDPDDYTTVNRTVLVPLAQTGAAVAAIDHLLASALMHLPATIGDTAEPELHDALAGVAAPTSCTQSATAAAGRSSTTTMPT